jgi:hypothetical protein
VAIVDETEARRVVARAVEALGGGWAIVASPRHPHSSLASETVDVGGRQVVVHFGEMSSPAIATLAGWVFEIKEHKLVLLDAPRRNHPDA